MILLGQMEIGFLGHLKERLCPIRALSDNFLAALSRHFDEALRLFCNTTAFSCVMWSPFANTRS